LKRIREKLKTQCDRNLFHWTINGLKIRAFADKSLHGKENVVRRIQQYNPEP
jgi:hypothetical protein